MSAGQAMQLELELDLDIPARNLSGPISKYQPLVDEIRRNPGRWYFVASRPSIGAAKAFAADIRRGKPLCMTGLQARVRRGYDVWARQPNMETR